MANTSKCVQMFPRMWKVIGGNGLPRQQFSASPLFLSRFTSTLTKEQTKEFKESKKITETSSIDVGEVFEENLAKSSKKNRQGSSISYNVSNSATGFSDNVAQGTSPGISEGYQIGKEDKDILERIARIKEEKDMEKVLKEMINLKGGIIVQNEIIVEGLKKISKLQKKYQSLNGIKSKKAFNNLLKNMENFYLNLTNRQQVNCLVSLLSIFETDIHLIELLEHELMWQSMKMNISSVLFLYRFHRMHQETPLRKKVVHHLEDVIRRRAIELNKVEDIILVMSIFSGKRDSKAMVVLEERIFDVIDQMSVDEISNILYTLAKLGSRQPSLIRLLVVFLNKRYEQRNSSQICTLLFSCAKLSMYDEDLLRKLSADLLLSDLKDNTVNISILKSCSFLGWLYEEALTPFLDHLLASVEQFDSEQLESILLSLATLSYCPVDKLELLQSHCSNVVDSKNIPPLRWLNIVWSLAVLQKATPSMCTSVLTDSFYQTMEKEDVPEWLYKPKLVNINCSARFEIEDYNGPYLPDSFMSQYQQPQDSANKKEMTSAVVQCLHRLATENIHWKSHVITPSGYRIDAELCIDGSGDLVELDKAEQSTDSYQRVALKVLGFHDQILPSYQPKGPEDMIIRHLKQQGYKVITVPSNEWRFVPTSEKRSNYLKMKVKDSVSLSMDAF